jgi:hypothetical protein
MRVQVADEHAHVQSLVLVVEMETRIEEHATEE